MRSTDKTENTALNLTATTKSTKSRAAAAATTTITTPVEAKAAQCDRESCKEQPPPTDACAASSCMCYYQLKPVSRQQQSSQSSKRIVLAAADSRNRELWRFLGLIAIGGFFILMGDKCGMLPGAGAAPQSCILCDKGDLKAKDPGTNYEEFLFEHQVTRQDAVNALRSLNESFFEGPAPDSACKTVTCSKKAMKYCLGPQFINDHCWCELGHTEEGLPYVPHICYVGEKRYTASVGSCFFYEEVKECCCGPALAKEWRHISGASTTTPKQYLHSAGHSLRLMTTALLLLFMVVGGGSRI